MTIRRLLIGFGVIAAVAVAAHGVYWWIAAAALRDGLSAWAEDRRAAGWTVSHAAIAIGGYPLRVAATVGDPDIAGPGEPAAWRWRGPSVRLVLRPWRPREIRFSSPGRHRVDARRGGRREIAEASAASLDGRVVVAPDGRLESIVVDIGSADVRRPGTPGRLRMDRLRVTLSMPGAPPGTAAKPDGEEPAGPLMSLSAANVVLPDGPRYAFGRTVRTIAIEAKLLGDLAPGPTLPQILAAWRDAGGTLEIRRLHVVWGEFDLSGEGTLALDGALQPIAAMTARIEGYREIVDALVETGTVKARDALVAKLVLGMVARATPGGTSRLTVPVTVQNGVLSAGPARLLKLRAIDWNAIGGATR